jgi:hypothetical protein
MKKLLWRLFFWSAWFAIGVAAGLCVKVFIVRGAPIIAGGGELLILLGLPICLVLGFNWGAKVTERRWRKRYDRLKNSVR